MSDEKKNFSKQENRNLIKKFSFPTKISLWIFAVLSFLFTIYGIYNVYNLYKEQDRFLNKIIEDETKNANDSLELYFEEKMQLCTNFSEKLSSGEVTADNLKEKMYEVFSSHTEIFSVLVAYKPYAYDEKLKLFCPYWYRQDNQEFYDYDTIDYTIDTEENDWYNLPLKNKASWIEPYAYEFNGKYEFLFSYCVPFYKNIDDFNQQKNPIGVIDIDLTTAEVRRLISNINLGKSGYAYLLSEGNKVLYHPDEELVQKGTNVTDLLEDTSYNYLKNLIEDTKNNTVNSVKKFKNVDPVTDKKEWKAYIELKNSNCILISSFSEDEFALDNEIIRKAYLRIVLPFIIFILFLINILTRIYLFHVPSFKYVILTSITFTFGLIMIWMLTIKFNKQIEYQWITISDKLTLKRFEHKLTHDMAHDTAAKPIFIPTGVFIQSLKFEGPNDLSLSGYVWQKYPTKFRNIHKIGAIFPEASSITIDTTYYLESDSTIDITIKFDASIRQTFDYSTYPFDDKDVWLRLWNKELSQDVIFVPDFTSYEHINPSSIPGLDPNIVLSEWNAKQTTFHVQLQNYHTTFGMSDDYYIWEYYYNIVLGRDIIGPFVSILLPFFVILILLYATLLVINKTDIITFLAGLSGLLFTVLLSHYSLRSSLNINQIVYFEYFYFVLYVIFVLLIINAFMYYSEKEHKFIQHHDNIIIKLIYWPLVMTVLFIITFLKFY